VQDADGQTGQRAVPQLCGELDDALSLRGPGAADPRRDDEHLPTGAHLFPHPLPGAIHPGRPQPGVHDDRAHVRASGRQLGEGGRLQVAEDRHRHRSGNRGRGEHEHVRLDARLAAQHRSLLHSEPVLLIDHDQPEVGELDVLAEQGVGADDDPGLAARGLQQGGPPGGRSGRARQQDDVGGVVR